MRGGGIRMMREKRSSEGWGMRMMREKRSSEGRREDDDEGKEVQ